MWLMVHRSQLNACFIVNFTLADIRTVQNVIFVIQSHKAVLLLTYLLLLEVCTALAFISLHFLSQIIDSTASVLHQVRLPNISIALRICRGHSFADAIVLWQITSLFGSTTIHTVIIILSLSAPLTASIIMKMHRRWAVQIRHCTCKLNIILLKFISNKLVSVAEFRELNLFLFDKERWQSPFTSFLVPFGFLLDFVHLLIVHQIARDLLKEIELFGLLANRIKKLLIPISILFVNIFKLICCCFVFLPKFLDNLSAIFDFLLEVIVLFIFFEKCFFLSLLFFKQFYLLLFLFFKLQLHLTLCLSLLSLLLFKGITTLHQLSLHLQEQIF